MQKDKKNYPLISIIVPLYNVAAYLERCLQSLLKQTYQNLEIILVNDASTDDSLAICRKYAQQDKRIRIIDLQSRQGPASARNAGMAVATGAFWGFVDSDDYCDAKMYEELYSLIQQYHTQVAAVNYYKILPKGLDWSSFGFNCQVFSGEDAIISCVQGPQSFCCNKLFAKELFRGIQLPTGQWFEDLAVCYRLYDRANGVAVSDKPLYYYNRTNMSSLTLGNFSVKKLDYFKASSDLLAFCRSRRYKRAEKIVLQERIWHIAGFLHQMALHNFKDKQVIGPLIRELRGGLWIHLKTSHKISNKLFALACCVNYPLAAHIDRAVNS